MRSSLRLYENWSQGKAWYIYARDRKSLTRGTFLFISCEYWMMDRNPSIESRLLLYNAMAPISRTIKLRPCMHTPGLRFQCQRPDWTSIEWMSNPEVHMLARSNSQTQHRSIQRLRSR